MLRTIAKLLKLCFYALLILAGVTFAVSNRGRIDVTFFPLPYALQLPLFLFALVIFALGSVVGWMIAHLSVFKSRRTQKNASLRITALENELGALRTESTMKPAVLPPQ